MKKNAYRIAGIFSVISFLLVLSCRKDSGTNVGNSNLSLTTAVASARQWHLEKTSAFGPLLAILQDRVDPVTLQPNWKNAYIDRLSDGTDILVVPTDEKTLHNNQISIFRKFIFTYHNNTISEGNIVEFLGDEKFITSHSNDLITKEREAQIDGYSGFILNYDINYVYETGAVYTAGKKNERAQAKLKEEYKHKSINNSSILRKENSTNTKEINLYSNDVCIATYVTMIYVDGDGTEYAGTPILLDLVCPESITPDTSSGTLQAYGGTGIISSHGPNVVANIRDYMKCFSNVAGQGHTYSVKLCVDQPTPGTRDAWGWTTQNNGVPINVGHTFLIFTETKPDGSTISRNIGFYPSAAVYPGNQSANGELDDNSAHGYNISLDISVDNSSFTTMLNSIINRADVTYNLSTNNCTTFALNTLSAAGVNINATTGSWAGGAGKNPGDLGEDIRGMNLPANMTRSTSAAAHPNSGTCY